MGAWLAILQIGSLIFFGGDFGAKHAALSFFSHETWELGDAFPARDRRAVIKGHSVGWVVFKGLYYLYI